MSNLQDATARQNGDAGNEVGTCFITSDSYPDFNYLISLVDLPTPSEGFTYSFEVSYANGWLTYTYEPDPNASATALTTYVMPPFLCDAADMNGGAFTNVTVVDQAKTKPKTGQVSNIQFQGKFKLPPHSSHMAIENKDTTEPSQAQWFVNLFIINSATQPQTFGIVTCPLNPYLDGYNGPYEQTLSIDLAQSGNVGVTPVKATSPESAQIHSVAIGVGEALSNVTFGNWQVNVLGVINSGDVEGNFPSANQLSSTNPTATL
jgi:hypothetical protein